MTAASFPSKMMSTSIKGEFCGAAYAFWEEICWKPTVYGEWWKHVSKSLILLLAKSCGLWSIWWSKQRESPSINLYNIQQQQTISITFARFRSTTSQIKRRLQWDCSAVVDRVSLVPRLWSTLLPLTKHVPKVTRHFRITITGLRTRYVLVPAEPV